MEKKYIVKDILKKKSFYSNEIEDIKKLVGFTYKNVEILGSFGIRSQLYYSDVDMFENSIKLSTKKIEKEFKKKIKQMLKDDTYYIGDIKCGTYDKFKIIDEKAYIKNSKVYFYDYKDSLNKLNQLKHYFKPSEYDEYKKLLKKKPSQDELNKIIKNLRLHIIRWKPTEILDGFKILIDGTKYKFIDAIPSNSLFKLDFIKYMKNGIFQEFSIIYDIRKKNNQRVNNIYYDTRETLINDINIYKSKKKYFKVLKRYFSLLKYDYQYNNMKSNKYKIIVLNQILNNNISSVYQVLSIIENMIFLFENEEHLDKKRIDKSVDTLIHKLSFIFDKSFINEEKEIIGDLKLILRKKSVGNTLKILNDIYDDLESILNKKSKKYMEVINI